MLKKNTNRQSSIDRQHANNHVKRRSPQFVGHVFRSVRHRNPLAVRHPVPGGTQDRGDRAKGRKTRKKKKKCPLPVGLAEDSNPRQGVPEPVELVRKREIDNTSSLFRPLTAVSLNVPPSCKSCNALSWAAETTAPLAEVVCVPGFRVRETRADDAS